ncbi:MAG: hypothetical protein U0350_50995 [Caldilineaceae bacterium]
MTLSQLLLALGLYISLGGIVVAYAACVIAGRTDDTMAEEGEQAAYSAVTYNLGGVQDEQLVLG